MPVVLSTGLLTRGRIWWYCDFQVSDDGQIFLTKVGPTQAIKWLHLPDTLRWRHNGRDSVSNRQPHDWLLNRLFRRRSKKASKLRVTGLCAGNSPGNGEFPTQMASNAENVSIWWRHRDFIKCTNSVFDFVCTKRVGQPLSIFPCEVVHSIRLSKQRIWISIFR